MAEKFPTPQERAMAWLLDATEIGGMSRPETALYAYQPVSRRRSTCASKSKHDSTRRKPMTMLLAERLRDLATQTHLLETKVSSLGWMAGAATDEEIEAGARVLYRQQDNDWLPFEEASKCTREECCRKALAVLKAMQGKATEGGR